VPADVLIAAGLAGVAYLTSPYVAGSLARRVVWSGDRRSRKVAITFDDGPDPRYTPRCLEILRSHGVRATFFLVGEQVQQRPELAREIKRCGHDIGNHTWSHRRHWLLTPATARAEVRRAADAIREAVGAPPRFFRPAYGAMNIFTYCEARRLGELCVMWSLPARDWRHGRTADGLVERVGQRLRGGSIVLLHDSRGAPGAPAVMLEALPGILAEVKRQQFEPVTVSEMLDGTARRA
jgi:peptidoglycan/xylan/chitin deacetylase (PgdA/CDA1 family)